MLLSPFKMKSKKVDDNKGKQPKYAIRNNENKQINNKKKNPVKNGQRPKDSSPKNTYRWLTEHMKRYPTSLIIQFSSVQLLRCVRLFATPRTAAHQASLSITNSQSLLKLMFIESVMPSISSSVVPFSSCLQPFPASGSFPISLFFISDGQSTGASASASVLPMNVQG